MSSIILAVTVAALLGDSTSCQKVTGIDATTVLRHAAERTGLTSASGKVLHVTAFDVRQHAYESDRVYPPYLTEVRRLDHWFDPASGVERITAHTTIGGYEYSAGTELGDARASYARRDTVLTPNEQAHASLYETRPLNVWAMLDDWLAASDVRVECRCSYRDYPRLVLSRRGINGAERLFVDEKSGYPIKLDRMEPHYLWGQLHTEFVYSTWQRVGDAHVPSASFRLEDGVTMITRTFGASQFVRRDSAPSLVLPSRQAPMSLETAEFLRPSRPDTVRVSATTFLLRNRGYTETVSLVRDTVFVFDATQGEERVREDALWIAALFPGRHPVVVVVTDLAWPHVAGVRAWVARGATIVSHRAAHTFLAEVVSRRWTMRPDLLERRRPRAALHFRAVDDSLALAGGDILLFPIDGAASEVALAAFVRPDRFLWASDFIQNLRSPTQYLDEVYAAVQRAGVSPIKVGAEHVPLTAWDRIAPLAEHAIP
jgi:hypothetical protein